MKLKQFFFLVIILCGGFIAHAQYDTTAPYLKNKQLPAFTLLNIDSVEFNQTVLDKSKKTIIMLFNPECEHCQKQLTLLLSMPEIKQSVQIILSTTETMEKLNIFYKKFNLQQYPFIHPGKDHHYLFGKFFQPKTIPVLAFYNDKQQFISVYQGNISRKVILDQLK
jgi:thiol-disulfide isomerase/thioredoxin